MKCPKCQFENPNDLLYCGKCGSPLQPSEKDKFTQAETFQVPKEELTTGITFAGRYQIIEEIGKGGMGKVYKVLDKEINANIALKLIKPEVASDEKTIERFRNELKTAREITHKNVCRMYDLNKEKGSYYITMEYVPGEDLRRLIRKVDHLGVGKAISIAKQICKGLSEAHRLGVIHRDLKPQNVLVDEEGNARIMDFGIARSIKTKGITERGLIIGTPEYMSPEQVEAKQIDHRSDIYSLGVLLYEMLTGKLPFEGETPLSIAMKHKSEMPKNPAELNAQIPEDLCQAILKCMEKDKEKRYQSTEELLLSLRKVEEKLPTTEKVLLRKKPLTSKEITVKFSIRNIFISAAVITAIVIAGIYIFYQIPHKEAILSPKIENSVAIISFENQTGDRAFDYLQKAIPNLLITNLENTGSLYVATWERMGDLIMQMGEDDVDLISSNLGFEVCRREGIKALVLGSFMKAGDMFATDVKVLDVETKKLIKSATSKGDGVNSILKVQIDELSREISQAVVKSGQEMDHAKMQIANLTTTSLEAYHYFLMGKESFEKLYVDEAREYLEKAIEHDSDFAVAYLYLGRVYNFLVDPSARNRAYEKAKTLSLNVSKKEKLYIDAAYARNIERNEEKSLRIYQALARKYPKEKNVFRLLGRYYSQKGLFKEAIQEFSKALDLDPNDGSTLNYLAYHYLMIKDYDKAIENFERYALASPEDANPFDSMGEAYFRMGDLDEAIAKYKRALEVKPGFGSAWALSYIYALKEDYPESLKRIDQYIKEDPAPGRKAAGYIFKSFLHILLGQGNDALSNIQTASSMADEIGNDIIKDAAYSMKAFIYYSRGDLEPCQQSLDNWFDFLKNMYPSDISTNKARYNFRLGLLDLKKGRIEAARSKLNIMESLLPEVSPIFKNLTAFHYDYLHAEILLAEGSIDEAITVWEKASPLEFPEMARGEAYRFNIPTIRDLLARAYIKEDKLDKAITEYKRLITFDPDSENRLLIHPLYHFRLAKLYEQKGWEGKAIEHHMKFLNFWKDADPNIPEVADAKKRLKTLQ